MGKYLTRIALVLITGIPLLYWLGTTLLKDVTGLPKIIIYYFGFLLLDYLAKKILGNEEK